MILQAFSPLFVPGGFGGMELAVIFLIAVLLFGANKIPKLARSTGQAMGEFRRGREEIEQELEEMSGEFEEATQTDAGGSSTSTSTSTSTGGTQSESPAPDEDTDETK